MTLHKNMTKRTCRLCLLTLGFLFAAAVPAVHAAKVKGRVEAFCTAALCLNTPLSGEETKRLRETGEGIAFTAWGERKDVTVEDPDLGRRVQTDVLVLDGPSGLVLPLAPALPERDDGGCLIGEKTAWELFGSVCVAGDRLCVGGETRLIQGVVRVPQSGVVLSGSLPGMEEAPCFDRISVQGGAAVDAEAFLTANGLDGVLLRLDKLCGLRWLPELIPGKWSDFPGWKEHILRTREDFSLLLQAGKNGIEQYAINQCFLYVWDRALQMICIAGALNFMIRLCYTENCFIFLCSGLCAFINLWYNISIQKSAPADKENGG